MSPCQGSAGRLGAQIPGCLPTVLHGQSPAPPSLLEPQPQPRARIFLGRGWQERVLLTRFPRLAGGVDEDSLDLHHPPLLAGVSRGAGGCGEQLRGRVGGFWGGCGLGPHGQAASGEFGLWDITTDPMGLPAACLPCQQPRVPLWHPAGRRQCLRERCLATPQAPKEPRSCS